MKKLLGFIMMMLLSFSAWSMQINVNKADASDLAHGLSGVGMAKAEEIVRHRELHGEFKNLQDFEKVRGIGTKLIERNMEKIIFSDTQ
jgi:competence protein ComEA